MVKEYLTMLEKQEEWVEKYGGSGEDYETASEKAEKNQEKRPCDFAYKKLADLSFFEERSIVMDLSNFEESVICKALWKDVFLSRSNFHKIHLTDATFSNVDLSQCDFKESILENISFKNCDLRGCNFANAKLKNVVFEDCSFFFELENATLQNCSFFHIRSRREKPYIDGAIFEDCSFSDLYFSTEYMETVEDVVFIRCDFNDVIFSHMKLIHTKLIDCDLEEIIFKF